MQVTLARCLGRLAFWLRFIHWLTAPAHLTVALRLRPCSRKSKWGVYTVSVKVYNQIGMIISFADEATADLYHGRRTSRVRRFPHDILHRALVRLDVLNTAQNLMDLSSPPGNRLEALSGDWAGFHSIRINRQWRIVFRWENGNAYDVQLIDYH